MNFGGINDNFAETLSEATNKLIDETQAELARRKNMMQR